MAANVRPMASPARPGAASRLVTKRMTAMSKPVNSISTMIVGPRP
jgi:hypothetical protein